MLAAEAYYPYVGAKRGGRQRSRLDPFHPPAKKKPGTCPSFKRAAERNCKLGFSPEVRRSFIDIQKNFEIIRGTIKLPEIGVLWLASGQGYFLCNWGWAVL